MNLISKVAHRSKAYYRDAVIREQYPMLTWLNRRELESKGAIGAVYMLHHIAPKDQERIPTNEDLKVSPDFLEKIILKYRKQEIDIISLDEVYERLTIGKMDSRPFISFTIDDGYLDNYTNALPIFEKNGVPFAIFVATDFIDQKAILWWDCLEDLILSHDSVVTSDGTAYPCKSFQQRWDTFRYLREKILQLDQDVLEDELNAMFDGYQIDWHAPIKSKGLSWQQVRELASHPLCTIGGHTISHPALNKLSAEKVKYEIVEGISRIEEFTQQKVQYFAYPYGTPNEIGNREYQIVTSLNMRMAFMAHQGCLTHDNIKNVVRLPRVYLHETLHH